MMLRLDVISGSRDVRVTLADNEAYHIKDFSAAELRQMNIVPHVLAIKCFEFVPRCRGRRWLDQP